MNEIIDNFRLMLSQKNLVRSVMKIADRYCNYTIDDIAPNGMEFSKQVSILKLFNRAHLSCVNTYREGKSIQELTSNVTKEVIIDGVIETDAVGLYYMYIARYGFFLRDLIIDNPQYFIPIILNSEKSVPILDHIFYILENNPIASDEKCYQSAKEVFDTLVTLSDQVKIIFVKGVWNKFMSFQSRRKLERAIIGKGNFDLFCELLTDLGEKDNLYCEKVLETSKLLSFLDLLIKISTNNEDEELLDFDLEASELLELLEWDKYLSISNQAKVACVFSLLTLAIDLAFKTELSEEIIEAINSFWPEPIRYLNEYITQDGEDLYFIAIKHMNAINGKVPTINEKNIPQKTKIERNCYVSIPGINKRFDLKKLVKYLTSKNELSDLVFVESVNNNEQDVEDCLTYFFDSYNDEIKNIIKEGTFNKEFKLKWNAHAASLRLLIRLLLNNKKGATVENVIDLNNKKSSYISDEYVDQLSNDSGIWPNVAYVFGYDEDGIRTSTIKDNRNKGMNIESLRTIAKIVFSCKKGEE